MTDLAVIMSIYKQDKLPFVKESVESILNQTFSNFHYYLIFDGPVSDEVKQYITALKDDRVRLFRHEKNMGLAVAMNTLLEIVLKNPEYRYIARMDADDISVDERFDKQKKYLNENPDISVLGSYYEEINESGKTLALKKLPIEHDMLRKRYLIKTPFAHSSVMFNRRLFDVCGLYPTDTYLMEDNFLWGKSLAYNLKFSNFPEMLLKFRIDRNYYKRRSGFSYGLNYIKTKFKINKMLDLHVFCYFITFFIGISRMMPSVISRLLRGWHV